MLSAQGPVEVERGGATPDGSAAAGREQWRAVEGDETLCPGDHIRVGPLGRAAVQLADEVQTVLRLDERTTLSFPPREPEASPWLDLVQGVMHFITRVPRRLQIHTPFVNATVEGTELVLRVGEAETELIVFEGRVRFANAAGGLVVASQEAAIARAGQRPVRRVLVKPREAVEWALYYPPLIDLQLIAWGPERHAVALREAASAYRRNDLAGAFTALERVPRGERGGTYFLLRAGLLLSVGRVREAEVALAEAERADPKSGGASALRSVIALVRDQKEEALRLARAGAMLDPRSPLPESALSYAYQGRFEIERALEHARRAVDLSPEDALLWARVSELELSRGDLDAALEAAKKAEFLNPTLARTQTVLGFAYLTRIEVERAKEAFEHAIRGDPADPLPRLGMGLAKIRDGDLEGGTREIETAASLDPNNSLVRSYLGKAYFEEKRGGLAETEFEQAKLLDPEDPTPWFYDAIQKQTTNRPVEALHDLERAMARNDNRAVYRSRLLLDEDRAARGASLARIYDDLGFTEPARVIATGSLTSDPAGPPAHRFLSDIYARLPRHEVSRLSELLQWQLLKAPTLEAVQPRLQVSYLNIAPGIAGAEATFNEYTSLYERDRVRMLAAAFGGNQNTFGDEVLLTGSYRAFTLSLSQFHSDTDGFRRNADVQNDLYDAFAQVAVTPSLSVQAEYRSRDTDQGNINLNFDPRDFSSTERREIRQDTARLGARYRISQRSDLIASMIHGRRETTNTDIDRSTGIPFAQGNEDEGYQFEAQYLFRGEAFNLIAGGARYDIDDGDQTFEFGGFTVSDLDVSRDQSTAYVYSHFQWPRPILWTAGLSYDYYEQKLDRKGFDLIDDLYPKLGVQWHIFDGLELRAAYFGVAARAGVVDQTIEPTQVAGFNQWFDDFRGTEAERVGVGLDARFTDQWYAGIEASWRDLTVPNQIQLPVDPPQFTFGCRSFLTTTDQ